MAEVTPEVPEVDKQEFLATARKRYELSEQFEREDRELAADDFAFAAGEQWPLAITQQRQRDNRPCLTVNRLTQFIKQVTGEARKNPVAIKVHPVDSEADVDTAEIYEGLIRNIEAQSSAQQSYMRALDHAVRGGFGHYRIVTEEVDDGFEQDIRIRPILNPFAVCWDPNAKEYTKADARFGFVWERITKELFAEKYPDKVPNDWSVAFNGTNNFWLNAEGVVVAEYWVKVPVTKTIGKLENGAVVDLTECMDYLAMIPLQQGPQGPMMKQVKSHKVVCHKMTGADILDDSLDGMVFPSKYIPILSVYGPEEFIGGRNRHVSLVRYAKDPQRMYNYWQSSITEKIALAPKSPFIGTTEQFSGHELQWDRANTDNKSRLTYTHVNGVPPPMRQHPADINEAEIIQSKTAVDDMKAAMGIYDPSLGKQSNETSGRAILARQQQGDTATFDWIDNLARTIEHGGRILIDMIPHVYDSERAVRVLGNDMDPRMVNINQEVGGHVLNDMTVGKYDLVVSVGPSYQTKRLESAETLTNMLQNIPQIGQYGADIAVKAIDAPWAAELSERLEKALPPGMIDPKKLSPEEAQAMQQQQQQQQDEQDKLKEIAMKEKLAEVEKTVVESDQIRANTAYLRAQTESLHVGTEAQVIENDLVLNGLIPPGLTTKSDHGKKEAA